MKEIQYKAFSLRAHKKNCNLVSLNVCQFELTFKCGLHCKHCYTDCYNKRAYFKKELNTEQVKFILDKVYNAGVVWLCFTGGDPLTREDFPDIYAYAKNKGFIVTVFTNAYSMTTEIAACLKKRPPFVIEMTLNAVTEDLYEKMSQVKGSFAKVTAGIDLIRKAKLPLKIKTQITRDNLGERHNIKKYIEGLGLKFKPNYDLYARLNRDLAPCNLRVSPQELLNLNGNKKLLDNDCQQLPSAEQRVPNSECRTAGSDLFRCAIGGGDSTHIDPYGNMFSCVLIRNAVFNLLKTDIEYARDKLLSLVRDKKFTTDSKCNGCNLIESCHRCPGRAYVETGDMEHPVHYYCELAKNMSKHRYL